MTLLDTAWKCACCKTGGKKKAAKFELNGKYFIL